MKKIIRYLPLVTLFVMIVPLSLAQQNRNLPKPNSEIDTLKKRISELESQLQTLENVEKMELAAKLADANAKLANAEFGKFERNLKDSNSEWLRNWSLLLLAVLSVFGVALWSQFKSKVDQLIADEVQKSLDRFKEAVAQVDTLKNELEEAVGRVNILQDQIRILEKEHAASVLEDFMWHRFSDENPYPEQINVLPESALLDVFVDKMYYLALRCKAAEVLTNKGSTRLISPMLEFLNTSVDSDLYNGVGLQTKSQLRSLVSFLSVIHTQETYDGLKRFLNRLLTENPKHKNLFLTWTVFSLAYVSIELNRRDSVSIIRKSIPDLDVFSHEEQALKNLAAYFDRFNEPEGIKEILEHHTADRMPAVENRCLELLEEKVPEFVEDWKAQKETTNTKTEEPS